MKARKPYLFPLILLASIVMGGLTGYFFPQQALLLKPFGEIFLNLIFTAIVPMIFFSVSSAIARTHSLAKVGKLFFAMMAVFLFTSTMAAVYAIAVVKLFPPALGVSLPVAAAVKVDEVSVLSQIAGIFSVKDLSRLFSPENIPALIVFSLLVGFAATLAGKNGRAFANFLKAGEDVFMRVFSIIMYYAPIGFFAYFASMVSELGPKLMANYARVTLIYYAAALIYFIVFMTFYAWLAGGVSRFWKNILLPATTAVATCSSAASIPANLAACREMGVTPQVYETVIPLGHIIHKDGSVIGGIFKIAFLFGLLQLDFSGGSVLLTALGVSLLVGTVMGAIPSGGMLGELLILSVYGFPPSMLMVIAAISIIIDVPATLLNVVGNTVSAMMVDAVRKPS